MRKLVVLGIAKNIEKNVTVLKDCLDSILSLRAGSKAFIYENNSTDSTNEKLQTLALQDERVTVVCEKTDFKTVAQTWDNQSCRLENIAAARNKCMELWEFADANNKEESIVIWMDLDRVARLDPKAIAFLAEQMEITPPEVAQAFFAFSRNHKGEMYDTFAYRDEQFACGPELIGEAWWGSEHQNALQRHIQSSDGVSLRVLSACNGLAMYRSEAIRGIRFSAYPTSDMEAYYRKLFRDQKAPSYTVLQNAQKNVKTHDAGCLLGRYLFGTEGMWWRNNSGYNQPVVCEWLSFHFAMIARGNNGLFLIKSWEDLSGH
jgi:hypothetical protein